MRKLKTMPSLCECCGKSYTPKRTTSRFCSDSCRVNNYQKEKRQGLTKTPKGFVCPKCGIADLYSPVGLKHNVIRCGTCHSEWQLVSAANPPKV